MDFLCFQRQCRSFFIEEWIQRFLQIGGGDLYKQLERRTQKSINVQELTGELKHLKHCIY